MVESGSITCRHLDPATEALVRDWFGGRVRAAAWDGARSVRIDLPGSPGRQIKIKGAGLKTGGIDWRTHRRTGPRHPVFDFDGRMTEDRAFGHDNALAGGASFQQAATEWATTKALELAGEAVVPCLGYGAIRRGEAVSWFSVFDWRADWAEAAPPHGLPVGDWRSALHDYGPHSLRLAVDHGLIGYFWYVTDAAGRRMIKDVHPFRRADPLAMSAVGWVLSVYFGLHIRCNQIEFAAIPRWNLGLARDAILWPLQGLCPEMTLEDHARLRAEVVAPYIVACPADFSAPRLAALLPRHPIMARLMDLCPPEFARF